MSTLTPRLDKLDKNYIINGGFDFWQRGSVWTSILSTDYRADRFLLYTDATGVGEIRKTEDAPANTDIQYCAEFDMTSTPQDGDNRNHRHIHRIESVFSRSLKGKNLNLSFYYKTTDFTHVDIRLRVPTVRDDWSSATEISLTEYAIVDDGNWNRLTINIPSVANIEDGFEILIFTKFRSSAGATNWKITGVMLTEDFGTVQDFTRAGRNCQQELLLCKRYFFLVNDFLVGARYQASGGLSCFFPIYLEVKPRVDFVFENISGATKATSTPGTNQYNVLDWTNGAWEPVSGGSITGGPIGTKQNIARVIVTFGSTPAVSTVGQHASLGLGAGVIMGFSSEL